MARLAFALAIYTGQRRSDIVRLGPPMIYTRTGSNIPILGFTQEKNRARKPVRVNIPMHTELLNIIEASETGDETYLVGWKGDPTPLNHSVIDLRNGVRKPVFRITAPFTDCEKRARKARRDRMHDAPDNGNYRS